MELGHGTPGENLWRQMLKEASERMIRRVPVVRLCLTRRNRPAATLTKSVPHNMRFNFPSKLLILQPVRVFHKFEG
jgi:hypothetical protein